MNRIANLAATNQLLSHLFRTQQRVNDEQLQVTTEQVSQDYAGIAQESGRLVRLENTRDVLKRFVDNNEMMQLRLKGTNTAVEAVQKGIRDFRSALLDSSGKPMDRVRVVDIQGYAFRALQEMEAYLNTDVDGRFLFAGSRVTTRPVDLGLATLADFQAAYDGSTVTYPETRDAQLAQFSLTGSAGDWLVFEEDPGGTGGPSRITATTAAFANVAPGTRITLSGTPSGTNDGVYTVQAVGGGGTTIDVVTEKFVAEGPVSAIFTLPDGTAVSANATGGLTFASGATETVTATSAGALANLPVGSAFTVSGTASNDGTYTVLTNDGTTITIASKKFVDQGSAGSEVTGAISAASYYNGDEVALTHRVYADRSFGMDLTAVNPAIEKAIRAMGIIAQGAYGTKGGLDQNLDRIQDAVALLNDALERTSTTTPPFREELDGNFEDVLMEIGFQQVVLDRTNKDHKDFIGTLETRISTVENIDRAEAITRLLNDSRALEASYQAIARIRELSLTKFI